uniref:Uncharacterized protein n=1 Tax=Anguilla anguilla TaxID=7936 RepID=A0A0E9S5J1_ANGAN
MRSVDYIRKKCKTCDD